MAKRCCAIEDTSRLISTHREENITPYRGKCDADRPLALSLSWLLPRAPRDSSLWPHPAPRHPAAVLILILSSFLLPYRGVVSLGSSSETSHVLTDLAPSPSHPQLPPSPPVLMAIPHHRTTFLGRSTHQGLITFTARTRPRSSQVSPAPPVISRHFLTII